MKKTLLILAAIAGAAFVSCQKETNPEPTEPELTGKTYTLTVNATKAAGTKALAFDGANLVTSWAATDEVKVCKHGSATAIGTLLPKTTGSASTSISGSITLTDVNVGDKLDLIFPDTNWTYEGQDGTLATLASSFDFARAEVTVSNISGLDLTASAATFTNEQSLVKFTLFEDVHNSLISVNSLTISAASGKLVKSYAVSSDTYAPVYGDIVITPSNPTSEFYVALRNNSGAADAYTLRAQYGTGPYTYYTFVKSGVTFANGHYKAVNVKMTEESVIYTVAGTPAEVFGSPTWSPDIAANDMVMQADGTYRKTYTLNGTEVGPIKFKVVKNRDWANAWPTDDFVIDNVTKGTLVITFNPSTGAVNGYIESEAFTIAGDDTTIFGADWDPSNTDNDMVKQFDGTFLKNYTISSPVNIQFKVAQDHAWTNSWGDANSLSGNYEYSIPHAGTLHISFDPATGDIDAWMDDIRYTIAGDFNGWNVTADPMIKQADGTYKCEVSVPAGMSMSFEYKAVLGETRWIGNPSNGGNNFSIALGDLGATVLIFTYTPATNTLTAEEQQVKLYFKTTTAVENELCFDCDELGMASWPGTPVNTSNNEIIAGSKYYYMEFPASKIWGMTISGIYLVDRDNWNTTGTTLTFPEGKLEYFIIGTKSQELELLAGRPSEPSITIDGTFSDWDGIAGGSYSSTNSSIMKAYVTDTRFFLYFKMIPGSGVTFDLAGWRYFRLYFDKDSNKTTGWDTSHWLYAGADEIYYGENGAKHCLLVYHSKGGLANAAIEGISDSSYVLEPVANADGTIEVELSFARSELGTFTSDEMIIYASGSVADGQSISGKLSGVIVP